jgi:hypothetical protein
MTTPRLLPDLRGQRYGEVILAYIDDQPRVEVYNSFLLNDCPDVLWQALEPINIAAEFGATLAIMNGPRYWLMDGIGKIDPVEPILQDFGGITMRRIAMIEIDRSFVRAPYRELQVNRGAIWYFNAGSVVHELRTADGRHFVMQAYCVDIDATLNQATLHQLGGRLQLPEEWTYTTRVLDDELIVDTTHRPATVLQDEFNNTYTLLD